MFVVRAAHQQITRAPSLADVPGAALSSFRLCRRECDRFGRIVLDHTVEQGNPPDAPQLVKKRAGRTLRIVTADRGYGEADVDRQLTDLGVKNVVIPRKARPTQARRADEHRKAFRRTIKWRTGSEGRISYPKRGYGWDRTRIDGIEGARIWTGHGVLAHNLVKISALTA